MSLYIPGVQDYLPAVQPFNPDFNFYSSALQMKQSQYDAAYNKLSSVYGTLLNAPMLRDGNIARRDQFFKDAENQIKKISGLDLSRPENVDAAMTIFKPFYEDKQIVKDMTWTRQYQNELTRGENFRNCIDPKKCGGQYWDGGIQALHYKAEDFKNASDEDALRFESPTFTPFVNVSAEALQAAKDAGFSIQTDTIQGGYIVTTKNGEQLEQPLQEFFMGIFGSDPRVVEMFQTQAYIQRKQFVAENSSLYGSEAAAEQAYISKMTAETTANQATSAANTNQTADNLKKRKEAADANIRANGLILNSPEHAGYSGLLEQIQQVEKTKSVYENVTNLTEAAPNSPNIDAMRNRVDQIVAYGLLGGQLAAAAHLYAYRDYSQTLTADPFALQANQQAYDMNKFMMEKGYMDSDGVYHPGLNALEDEYLQRVKAELDGTGGDGTGGYGNANENTFVPDNSAEGTNASGEEGNVPNALEANVNKGQELTMHQSNDERDYLRQMAATLNTEFLASVGHKNEQGEDDGGMRQAMLKETAIKTFKGTGLDPMKVLNGTEDLTKIDSMSGAGLSKSYETAVSMSNPSTPVYGSTNSFWSQNFWDKTTDLRTNIQNRDLIMADYNKFQVEQSNTIVTSMKTNSGGEDAQPWSERQLALDALIDPNTGLVVSEDEFAAKFAKLQWDRTSQTVRDSYQGSFDQPTRVTPEMDQAADESMGFISWFVDDPVGYRGTDHTRKGGSFKEMSEASAREAYDKYVEEYNQTYIRDGRAYNANPNLTGASGGVLSGGAVSGLVDANNVKSRNSLYASSVFSNLNGMDLSGEGGAYVKYGSAGEKVQDEGAAMLLNQLMSDFYTKPTKGRKKPVFKMRYQTIAAGDANYSAVTFFPTEDWAKEYKGSKKDPGMTGDGKYREGITVLIPKDQENNDLATHSSFNDYEFVMQHTGKLTLDQFPTAGNVTLQKSGQGYQASGYINKFDENGNMYREPVYQFYGADFNVGSVYTTWQDQLKFYSGLNQSINSAITQTYGIKDPTKVPPYQK